METTARSPELRTVRLLLLFFIFALVVSGITAFPLQWELDILASLFTGREGTPLAKWIFYVRDGLHATNAAYPFLAYGTDWLAFAHLVIALFFIPPLRDPVRYIGNLYMGVVACIGVIPLALICGAIRGIPFYWRLLDCSFGLVGIVPLWLTIRLIRRSSFAHDGAISGSGPAGV